VFFVLEASIMDQIDGGETIWERLLLEPLATDSLLMCYRHVGFWKPMDTLRDQRELGALLTDGLPRWTW
jgi:glucose-1-phosphate cytidylyltransferase